MRSDAEIEPAFERIRAADAEAMIVLPDGLVMQHRKRIIGFAALQRIPVISGWSEFANRAAPHLRAQPQNCIPAARNHVDKILKERIRRVGHRATDKFELVINLKAAKAIGRGASDIARARRRGDRITLSFAQAGCCTAHGSLWHKADLPICPLSVRFRRQRWSNRPAACQLLDLDTKPRLMVKRGA